MFRRTKEARSWRSYRSAAETPDRTKPRRACPRAGREARRAGRGPHRPPEFPLVLVTWRDAWFDFDEPDPEDARADYLVSTVGFLVRSGPRFVSVAQEVLPDGDGFRAVTHIPVAVVEAIAQLHGSDGAGMNDLLAR